VEKPKLRVELVAARLHLRAVLAATL